MVSRENNFHSSQSSDFNQSTNNPYHESLCGSILLPLPTNCPSDVFAYLHHGQFNKFQRCLDVYHKEIIQIKNERGQVKLYYRKSFIFIHLFISSLYYMF